MSLHCGIVSIVSSFHGGGGGRDWVDGGLGGGKSC